MKKERAGIFGGQNVRPEKCLSARFTNMLFHVVVPDMDDTETFGGVSENISAKIYVPMNIIYNT